MLLINKIEIRKSMSICKTQSIQKILLFILHCIKICVLLEFSFQQLKHKDYGLFKKQLLVIIVCETKSKFFLWLLSLLEEIFFSWFLFYFLLMLLGDSQLVLPTKNNYRSFLKKPQDYTNFTVIPLW